MVVAALAAEPDELILKDLAKQAQQLADMVGWANDVIDKDGSVSEAFLKLRARCETPWTGHACGRPTGCLKIQKNR